MALFGSDLTKALAGGRRIARAREKESFMSLGGWEWVIIAVVALLLFGGARLANFGKGAGQAIRGFKDEIKPVTSDDATPSDDDSGPKA
jgi:sec-independent protein translocase protein TatA